VKGLEQAVIEKILQERARGGPYLSLDDLIDRSGILPEQLELLIRVNALRFTGKSKKELLWEGDFLQRKSRMHSAACQPMFRTPALTFPLPILPSYPLEDCYDDIELLGFPVCDPFILAADDPSRYLAARDLPAHVGKPVTVMGYHITHKPVQTVKGEMMSFGTFLDMHKDWIDTVHFPPVHAAYPPRSGFYRIMGKVVVEFGVYSIEVARMEKVGIRRRSENL
jgi:DNA polymerase-3 subunit alpha